MMTSFDDAAPAQSGIEARHYEQRRSFAGVPAQKIELIYILGCGRSGSTLLDLVLGAHPAIISVGEVWYHHRWLKNNFACTCGARFQSCAFWRAVTEKLRAFDQEICVTPVSGRSAKLRFLLQLWRGKTMPQREQAQPYALATYHLFKAVQEVARKPVVLDSSKNPLRLLYLHASGLFNIKVIHLVRDGRAYANSKRKPVIMPAQNGQMAPALNAWRAAWHWLMMNALSSLICERLMKANSCRIKYEEFASDPSTVTQRLCSFLNLSNSQELWREEKPAMHNISGSRWRFQAGSAIRLDEKWRTELPAGRRFVFAALAGWLNRRYGYR